MGDDMVTMQQLLKLNAIDDSNYDRRKNKGVKEIIDFLMDDLPSDVWETLPQYMQDKIIAVHAAYKENPTRESGK